MMRVRNMVSDRSGREVANQFILWGDSKMIFQSYQSIVCVIDFTKEGAEKVTLGRDWDYSNTTMKYLNKFLRDELGMNTNANGLRTAIKNKDISYNPYLY